VLLGHAATDEPAQHEEGPDEFAVLPTAPLEIPEDLASLPEPTPGAPNRVDPNPEADAIAALGGNAARARGAGADLVSYTTRFGVSGDIRPVLAAEDEDFRRRNDGRILERMFGTNVYFEAYRRQSLDRYAELGAPAPSGRSHAGCAAIRRVDRRVTASSGRLMPPRAAYVISQTCSFTGGPECCAACCPVSPRR
jgi:hypothetical protein